MSTPSIDGVLVAFKGRLGWSSFKKNVARTKEVCAGLHASEDAGSWSDRLFPPSACGKKNAYTELKTHLSRTKSFHFDSTYVFEDEVWRILPQKRVEAFQRQMREGKDEAMVLLENLISELPRLKELASMPAPAGRGDAYNPEDYPAGEEMRDLFQFEVQYREIPSGAGLNPALFQEAINQLQALHEQRLREANENLVERFLEPLGKLAEQMKDPAGRKIAPVLERILEVSALVPQLDLNNNTRLRELAASVHETFQLFTPDMLKQDEEMRKMVGDTAGKFVAALSTFGGVAKRAIA